MIKITRTKTNCVCGIRRHPAVGMRVQQHMWQHSTLRGHSQAGIQVSRDKIKLIYNSPDHNEMKVAKVSQINHGLNDTSAMSAENTSTSVMRVATRYNEQIIQSRYRFMYIHNKIVTLRGDSLLLLFLESEY